MSRYLILICLFLTCCKSHDRTNVRATVDPNPEFTASFTGAVKLEFIAQTFPKSERARITIIDAKEVRDFIDSFSFNSFPEGEITHCMCGGDPHVIVYLDDGSTRKFALHHGWSIRWEEFGSDLSLTQEGINQLGKFLDRHGIRSN